MSASKVFAKSLLYIAAAASIAGCGSDRKRGVSEAIDVYAFANACVVVESETGFLVRDASATGFAFAATRPGDATPFFMKASGLGTFLFYDDERGFLVSDDGTELARKTALLSDVLLVNDAHESEAEWALLTTDDDELTLRHRKSGASLTTTGLGAEAAPITLHAHDGCAEFPEDFTYAEGRVERSSFEDGAVFGFVDAHSHILANFAFGGGGIFHGAPFHRLGIEHALPSCQRFHAAEGRADLFGAVFDGGAEVDFGLLLPALVSGRMPSFAHHTEGYPEFTTWPSAHFSSTHQVQYYKWLERAYLGGLRLVVQHAVNNQIICDFIGNGRIQPIRYSCNDMVAVDRQLDEIIHMQDYIDAQEGGPGKGWFRVVTSPAEAREVIGAGKMAVLLGIEVSNLFDCFLSPVPPFAPCDEAAVLERLDYYQQRGVRAVFPVHKFDNAFSAGDGQKAFIELGNLLQTGHYSNLTTDCDRSVPTVFDSGPMFFSGLNRPREDYFAPAPFDFSRFFQNPLGSLLPILDLLFEPPIEGEPEHCQSAGLTPLGEFLIDELMQRGMIIEIDHLPRRSYKRAFEMLVENDYPAVGTHGLDNAGALYALGGLSTSGFGRCRDANRPGATVDGFRGRLQKIIDNGGYPGLGFGFDLNGFAGAPGPRFGPKSVCNREQTDPLTYPFSSYAGDVTFLPPSVGERTLDFNTEGLVHIGMLPELIEEVRRDGVSDADLEPLFRSAEAYLRMWEKAERRGAALRNGAS